MPQVLTTNAVIVCPHGGLGTSLPPTRNGRLTVGSFCGKVTPGPWPVLPPAFPCWFPAWVISWSPWGLMLLRLTAAGSFWSPISIKPSPDFP